MLNCQINQCCWSHLAQWGRSDKTKLHVLFIAMQNFLSSNYNHGLRLHTKQCGYIHSFILFMSLFYQVSVYVQGFVSFNAGGETRLSLRFYTVFGCCVCHCVWRTLFLLVFFCNRC